VNILSDHSNILYMELGVNEIPFLLEFFLQENVKRKIIKKMQGF
jgi:hypothetical protein